jgi:nitrous oxide reductase
MKVTVRRPHRRDFLKATGLLGLAGIAGIGSARTSKNGNGRKADDTLRLFSEVAVNGAREVVTEKTGAHVATGDGFAVVD